MLQEGIYKLSELRAALQESETKNEFKPVLGDGVEKDNKKNNGEAVKDITKEVGKYNGEKMDHTVVTPVDRNKTTLDVVWNELEPGKEWKDRVDAQVEGYPSVDNKKNTDAKDNGGLDYKGNEEFLKNREKLQKDWKGTVKDDMDAGLKGRELKKYNVVNENFDPEDDYMTTPDIVAKDFIKWATSEADKAPYPINAMQMVHDAYTNNDQDTLEDLAGAYFEAKYTDMAQWDDVLKGVEKAVNAYGYYNNLEHNNTTEDNNDTDGNESVDMTINNNEPVDDKPEPLDENKTNKTKKNMKRLHYKKTTFLTEAQMLKTIPEEFKTNGNKFYVKDASGTEYLVECTVDEKFDFPTLSVVSKLNESKTNNEINRMKQLFGYESSQFNTKVDKKSETLQSLHEDIEKVKGLEKFKD
jgi:hypothetical protein